MLVIPNRFNEYVSPPDPLEIITNQQGKISERQRLALRTKQRKLFVVGCVLLGIGVLFLPSWSWFYRRMWSAWVVIEGTVVFNALSCYWRVLLIELDLHMGQVKCSGGLITRGHHIKTSSQELEAIDALGKLAPGMYRLFYLPRAQMVLSAEPLIAKQELYDYQANALKEKGLFDEEEIELNRRGHLTTRQVSGLYRMAMQYGLGGLFFCCAAGILSVGLVFTLQSKMGERVWALSALTGASIIGLYLVGVGLLRVLGDIRGQQVKVSLGWSRALTQKALYSKSWKEVINLAEVREAGLGAGVGYRTYNAPKSAYVVAIEPIMDDA